MPSIRHIEHHPTPNIVLEDPQHALHPLWGRAALEVVCLTMNSGVWSVSGG
jgi:hypothetical protein